MADGTIRIYSGLMDMMNDGEIANSNLGGFIENLLNAQYSQQEEREADDYGIWILKNGRHDVNYAVSALKMLSTLGNDHSFLSSHPAPEARAKQLHEIANSPQKRDEPSTVRQIIDWVKGFLPSSVSGITLFMESQSRQ